MESPSVAKEQPIKDRLGWKNGLIIIYTNGERSWKKILSFYKTVKATYFLRILRKVMVCQTNLHTSPLFSLLRPNSLFLMPTALS